MALLLYQVTNSLYTGRLLELLYFPMVFWSSISHKVGTNAVLHWKYTYAGDVLPW